MSEPVEISIEPLAAEFRDGTPAKYAVMVTGGNLSQESVERIGKILRDRDETRSAAQRLLDALREEGFDGDRRRVLGCAKILTDTLGGLR